MDKDPSKLNGCLILTAHMSRWIQSRTTTWYNTIRCPDDVQKDSREKKEPALAVDLEDAYNRVQLKLLMELLFVNGTSQGFSKYRDLYNVYIKGLAGLHKNG